jgi:CheY-like chemotaxis protein
MMGIRTILLAEDSALDVELALEALAEHRLANDVVVVTDGVDALDYLRCEGNYHLRSPGNPAVVLLDIKMPKLDGLQVLAAMRSDEKLKSIPVVMLTSSREERDLVESYRLGVNAFVVKPVNFPEFLQAVKTLGVFWALINEPPPGANPPA